MPAAGNSVPDNKNTLAVNNNYIHVHILLTGSGTIADTFGFICRATVTFISEITANRFHIHFSDCVSGSDIFWCNYSLLCGALITFPYISTGAEEQPKSQCVSPNLITISWFFLYDNTAIPCESMFNLNCLTYNPTLLLTLLPLSFTDQLPHLYPYYWNSCVKTPSASNEIHGL